MVSKFNWKAVEKKWQRKWAWSKLHETDPVAGKPKYFVTAAYPYPNSPQHIGHGRTYTIADVNARFHRMRGFNTLFPTGFHYTGTPVFAMCKRLQQNDPEVVQALTEVYHVPKAMLERLKDPVSLARYFHGEIKKGMEEIGFSIDWRREFITIDPLYMRFIEWHFGKLRERGLITQGTHPVGWCPNDNGPVGQHDTQGDKDPEVGEYFLVKFESEGAYFPTATLRPETVFGVTNLWVNPDARYVRANVDGEVWVVSREAAEKLRHQKHAVEALDEVRGKELLWRKVYNPATKASIPILPGQFVAPQNGTGVVMSVPAHAPYDYQALADLRARAGPGSGVVEEMGRVQPLPIIRLEGWSEVPAADVVARFGVRDQKDAKLEDATQELYSTEFHRGVMRENTPYSGMSVSKARDAVVQEYSGSGQIVRMFEILNRPVFCRCGAECIVHILDSQWFINYGDPEWKRLAHQCLEQMVLLPEESRAEFRHTVDWLKEKACARKVGLGTRLPWDKDWVIESLSDSVVYMAYYILAKFFSKHWTVFKKFEKDTSRLPDSFFDYCLLGEGSAGEVARATKIPASIVAQVRKEFLYFYPVDMRHSGKDLVPNHLTFYIFHHVKLYPSSLWPRGVVANGFVLMEGTKMSKSMRNITPLRDAIAKYGADPVRVGVLATAELGQDTDFSDTLASAIGERLVSLMGQARGLRRTRAKGKALSQLDRWMLSRLNRAVREATGAMEKLRVREAINKMLYQLDNDLAWYRRRTGERKGKNGPSAVVLRRVMEERARMLAPVAPHTAEEVWSRLGQKGLVASGKWPVTDEKLEDPLAEQAESLVEDVLEDTGEILKATGMSPKHVSFYTAAGWKLQVYRRALEAAGSEGMDQGGFIRTVMADSELRGLGKQAADYSVKVFQQARGMGEEQRKARLGTGLVKEKEVLAVAVDFFRRELKAEVRVWVEDEDSVVDPKGRARLAEPFRPAIFVE